MEHAPVAPMSTTEAERCSSDQKDVIKLELVAIVTSMGRHAKIHPTVPTPGKNLPAEYAYNSTGFLICNNVLEAQVDQETLLAKI